MKLRVLMLHGLLCLSRLTASVETNEEKLNISATPTALIVNGTPTVMTPDLLQQLFAPYIKNGDYEILFSFIYNEAPKFFQTPLQNELMKWLAQYNLTSPLCLYLYLRLYHMLYSDQPLGHEQIINLWFKRYMAEILLEIDFCRLNIPQNDVELFSYARKIMTRYASQLTRWMEHINKIQVDKKEILTEVRNRINTVFSKKIDFHGDPMWLLTTELSTNTFAYLSSFIMNYNGDGYHFTYHTPTDQHPRIKRLKSYIRNKQQVGVNIKSHIQQALANIDKEIESLS